MKRYGLFTGTATTLPGLDSDARTASPATQVQTVQNCAAPPLEFGSFAYFFDVEISRTMPLLSPPTLHSMRLGLCTSPGKIKIQMRASTE
jgi:hypothetical protein